MLRAFLLLFESILDAFDLFLRAFLVFFRGLGVDLEKTPKKERKRKPFGLHFESFWAPKSMKKTIRILDAIKLASGPAFWWISVPSRLENH